VSDETIYDLEELMQMAVCDSVIPCTYCGYEPLEPDFDRCPECGKMNVLQSVGVI